MHNGLVRVDFETWRVFRRLIRLARRMRSQRHIHAVQRWIRTKSRTNAGPYVAAG